MDEAEDTADERILHYETDFVDDLEIEAFLLARWLDTG